MAKQLAAMGAQLGKMYQDSRFFNDKGEEIFNFGKISTILNDGRARDAAIANIDVKAADVDVKQLAASIADAIPVGIAKDVANEVVAAVAKKLSA